MTMKKSLTLFLLFTAFGLFSQKYELGKVTLDELNEKEHPLDKSAVAAILFKKGEIRYDYSYEDGFEITTKVSCKIKIYKKEGYDWANHATYYYLRDTGAKETVDYSSAVTYNLVDGKIEKTKLKSDGEFEEKINKFRGRKKITMPNVREGSIIEFQYLIKSDQIVALEDWDFQSSIPVNYSEFKTYIPDYFVYNTNQKGFVFPKITTDSKPRTINYSYIQGAGTSSERINASLNFNEKISTYTLTDVPALKDEAFVNNISNYTASLSHELSVKKYPNQPIQTLSTDWQTVTRLIYDNDNFGAELNKTAYFEADLNTILNGLSTRDQKIRAIFNFVKSKVKWDDYYGYSCNDGVKNAYKKGTGNAAEINLMLTAMLRYAKIEANPVLISTRSNGIAIFPNRAAFNYVIAAVEIENDLILLDATSPNALPNILPTRDLNWVGRMIRKDGTSAEVDLMPKMISKDIVNLMATIKPDGTVEGKVKEQYFDHQGFYFRNTYADLSKETQLERIETKYKGIEIEDYEIANKNDLSLPVIETYSFRHGNSVEIIGDKMYFSPLLFFAMAENPFKQETREYPVDFSYPIQDKYLINLTIPDGYAVETLPASVAVPMSDNNGSMKFMAAHKDKQIQLSLTMDINSAIIPSEYYPELKAFFAEVVKKQTDKIILKKI